MKPSLLVALGISLLSPLAHAQMTKPAADPKTAPAKPDPGKPAVPKESAESRAAAWKAQSDTLSAEQSTKLLALLNTGDDKALREIKGIGKARAQGIISNRPYAKIADLTKVRNIESSAFPNIITFAKGQQPAAAPKKDAPAKPDKPAPKKGE